MSDFIFVDGQRLDVPRSSVLFNHLVVAVLVENIAGHINEEFQNLGVCPVLMPILEGGSFFATDLMRHLDFPFSVNSIRVTTYAGREAQTPKLLTPLTEDVTGKVVLLIDDIYDTGATVRFMRETLISMGAAKVYSCTLLVRKTNTELPDFYGEFVAPDLWLYGYGMDYAHGQLRHKRAIRYVPKTTL